MGKLLVLIIGLCISMNALAYELPYKEKVEKSFFEKEKILNEFYNLFQKEKKFKILNYRSGGALTTSQELFGKESPYRGGSKKKYLKYQEQLWPLNVSNIVREDDRISVTVATARKYGSFIEVELNRYFEEPNDSGCEKPDFSKDGSCVAGIKGFWFIKYIWFVE